MFQTAFQTITSPIHAATSFALGVVAALPEMAGSAIFRRSRKLTAKLAAAAPSRGRFCDGYDLVADFAARKAYRRAARP